MPAGASEAHAGLGRVEEVKREVEEMSVEELARQDEGRGKKGRMGEKMGRGREMVRDLLAEEGGV